MKPRHQRMLLAAALVSLVAGGVTLVLFAFQSNLVFFYSPSQVAQQAAPVGRTFRLGGLVTVGSVQRQGLRVVFSITDTAHTLPVQYEGILPDLFKEGKGVVAQGQLHQGVFVAKEVLAKHDENYMPPEAAQALSNAADSNKKAAASLITP
jgi:cytochrome c-type biogenesis protein CcmE